MKKQYFASSSGRNTCFNQNWRSNLLLTFFLAISLAENTSGCIIDQPSITLGDRFTESLTKDIPETSILTCKVVTVGECKTAPTLLLVSSTGEKKVVNSFKTIVEEHFKDQSNTTQETPGESKSVRRAYFFKLMEVEFDRDYQWSINGDNNLGPFPFKFRDKSEYSEYSFVLVSNFDFSEMSANTHRALQETNWTNIDGFVHLSGIAPSVNAESGQSIDRLGLDSYFKSISSIVTKKPFFPVLGPKDGRDVISSTDLSFILPGQQSVHSDPWGLPPIYYFRQGTALIVAVDSWSLFSVLEVKARNQYLAQLENLLSKKEDHFGWKVVFLSTSLNCHPSEPGCAGDWLYSHQVLRELLHKLKVNLVIESIPGVARITQVSSIFQRIAADVNPHDPQVIDARRNPIFVTFGASGSKYTRALQSSKSGAKSVDQAFNFTQKSSFVGKDGFLDAWSESPAYKSFPTTIGLSEETEGSTLKQDNTQIDPASLKQIVPLEAYLKLKIRNAYLVVELHSASSTKGGGLQGLLQLTKDMWEFEPSTNASSFLFFVTSPLLVFMLGLAVRLLLRKHKNRKDLKRSEKSEAELESGVKICNKYWGQVDISVIEEEEEAQEMR